jgi:uncharacterized protein (DUF697 family)
MSSKQALDKTADNIILNHVFFSLGAGLVPVPLLDMAAVTVVQLDMLKQLSRLYDVPFQEESGKSLISAIAGGVAARVGASMIKAIPVVGTFLGGVSMSVLSGASTYSIGQVFKRHFSSGGNLTNIDIKKAKKIFEEAFEKGKDIATKMEKEKKENQSTKEEPPQEEKSIVDRLKDLAALRDQGIISEEEFTAQKKRLLDSI